MWCYNILRDNKGSISHILQLYNITSGSVLLADNLVSLISGDTESILGMKIIEWRRMNELFWSKY